MKILFVCTGNTCRSPIAQGLAGKIFPESYEILSSGINAWDGQPVNEKAVKVLVEKGIDISGKKAVKLSLEQLQEADYIFTMTKSQELNLWHNYPEYKTKIKCLGEFVGCDKEIPDPWGGSLDDYRKCTRELEKMLHLLADKLKAMERD